VAGNLVSLFSGEAVSSILAFVITILLARRLTDEGFGRLAFVQSIMVYLALVMDMGLGTFGAREIARRPESLAEYSSAIFSLRLLLGAAVALPFAVIVAVWPMPAEMRWLCWGSALGIFTQALNPEFAFQGSERMSGIAIWRVLVHLFYLTLIGVIVTDRGELWVVPLLRFAAEAITLILIAVFLLKKHTHMPTFVWRPVVWHGYLRESLAMAASVVVIKIYYTFDTIILGIIHTPSDVGIYQAAYKIILPFSSTVSLALMVFAPYFSRYWRDPESMIRVIKNYAILLIYIGSVTSIPLILLHKKLIFMIYGSLYLNAKIPLLLLAISLFLTFLSAVFLGPLLFSGKQKKYLLFLAIQAGLSIVLNLILIPPFGYVGAASVAIASSIFLLIISAVDFCRDYRDTSVIKIMGQLTLLASFVVFILQLCVQNNWLHSALFMSLFSVMIYTLYHDRFVAIYKSIINRS